MKDLLFYQEIFFGKTKRKLTKLTLEASSLSFNNNMFNSTSTFSVENGIKEAKVIEAETAFDCINVVMSHLRHYLNFIQLGHPDTHLYILRDGELGKYAIDEIFYTSDCITSEIEDKVEYAEKNGYREDWQDILLPEKPNQYVLTIYSDFNQIQIYDSAWEDDSLEWSDSDLENFVCTSTHALGLGVIHNDDHIINLILHDTAPELEINAWDHVVDAPFDVATGSLDIADKMIEIPTGQYTVRWLIKKINNTQGQYHIDMWKGDIGKVKVHKRLLLS